MSDLPFDVPPDPPPDDPLDPPHADDVPTIPVGRDEPRAKMTAGERAALDTLEALGRAAVAGTHDTITRAQLMRVAYHRVKQAITDDVKQRSGDTPPGRGGLY